MTPLKLSILSAGQETNSPQLNEYDALKPDYIQRQTKTRGVSVKSTSSKNGGFRRYDFVSDFSLPREGSANVSQNTWLIEDILDLDEASGCEITDLQRVLNACFIDLEQSPSAARMIKEATQYGWRISIEDLGEQDFHLDVPEKCLVLHDQGLSVGGLSNSSYFLNTVKVSLIRALRDIWQETRHGAFDEDYNAEYILLLERVRAADLDVLSILVAWELRAEGQFDLWRHMIGRNEGDMAMVYSAHMERVPASQFDGKALAAVFTQWFHDETRVNACDHETLQYMDEIMEQYPVGNPFGKRKPTTIGVEILSCLPDKTPYLRNVGHEILSNPLYSGMSDDINQAHFMQVARDCQVTYIEGVPFRDTMLAEKIFPDDFMFEASGTLH